MVEYIEFGDNYLPFIFMREILYIKEKSLFSHGVYEFNNILNYIQTDKFEDIYKKEYLTYDNKPITNFYDKIKNYSQSPKIVNTKFNFGFLHDYNYDLHNNSINNYNFVANKYDMKISDFKLKLKNEKTLMFINFSFYNKIENIKIDEMIAVLDKMLNKKYYIFLFFYDYQRMPNNIDEQYKELCSTKYYKHENVKVIFLKSDFTNWWNQNENVKNVLYGEMREGFLKVCSEEKIRIF